MPCKPMPQNSEAHQSHALHESSMQADIRCPLILSPAVTYPCQNAPKPSLIDKFNHYRYALRIYPVFRTISLTHRAVHGMDKRVISLQCLPSQTMPYLPLAHIDYFSFAFIVYQPDIIILKS